MARRRRRKPVLTENLVLRPFAERDEAAFIAGLEGICNTRVPDATVRTSKVSGEMTACTRCSPRMCWAGRAVESRNSLMRDRHIADEVACWEESQAWVQVLNSHPDRVSKPFLPEPWRK